MKKPSKAIKIAVIPARGGSKRIPRKNIKPFFGKPMIAWSIEAAKATRIFDHIIVSTDDDEIAEIGRQYGAEVPFTRPSELSDDYTGTTEVIAHATQWFINKGLSVNAVCCIYATAPFVQASDIKKALKEFESDNWLYAFSATDFAAPIFRSFEIDSNGGTKMFFPEHFETRSQDLPDAMHDAGQFYWGKANAWIKGKRIFDSHSKPVLIPRWRVQDIDTEADWERAQHLAESIIR